MSPVAMSETIHLPSFGQHKTNIVAMMKVMSMCNIDNGQKRLIHKQEEEFYTCAPDLYTGTGLDIGTYQLVKCW